MSVTGQNQINITRFCRGRELNNCKRPKHCFFDGRLKVAVIINKRSRLGPSEVGPNRLIFEWFCTITKYYIQYYGRFCQIL